MSLILLMLLASIILGIAINPNYKKSNSIVDDDPTNDVVIDDVIPDSFAGTISNSENVPVGVLNLIKNYMDDYYKSLYTLEQQDTSKYFSNDIDGQISNLAIKLTVESRKLYDFDFKMSDAHYDLDITNFTNGNGKYYIDFLENDYFKFKFLNGISSESYDIENSMTIEEVNGELKIVEFEKIQGYYTMFNDNKDENLDEIYKYYFDRLKATIENEEYQKTVASQNSYSSSKQFDVAFNRTAAVEYMDEYCHKINEDYYDFNDEGGNCQNFASQALIAGGMIMDDNGEYNWYFNGYLDYSSAWVQVNYFNEYCKENQGTGLVCEVNANMAYAQPGDIVQVGISSIEHTTIVSKVVDGHVLLDANSIDMKDFPLEAYVYPYRKLIKVLGSNY